MLPDQKCCPSAPQVENIMCLRRVSGTEGSTWQSDSISLINVQNGTALCAVSSLDNQEVVVVQYVPAPSPPPSPPPPPPPRPPPALPPPKPPTSAQPPPGRQGGAASPPSRPPPPAPSPADDEVGPVMTATLFLVPAMGRAMHARLIKRLGNAEPYFLL